jgi:hypothetical protein
MVYSSSNQNQPIFLNQTQNIRVFELTHFPEPFFQKLFAQVPAANQ